MRRGLLSGIGLFFLAACTQLPTGSPVPVSARAQLVTVCASLAALQSELARRITDGELAPREIATVRAMKPIADDACLNGESDPELLLARARMALIELRRLREGDGG